MQILNNLHFIENKNYFTTAPSFIVDKETTLEYLIIRLFYSGVSIYNNYISKGLRFKRTGRLR